MARPARRWRGMAWIASVGVGAGAGAAHAQPAPPPLPASSSTSTAAPDGASPSPAPSSTTASGRPRPPPPPPPPPGGYYVPQGAAPPYYPPPAATPAPSYYPPPGGGPPYYPPAPGAPAQAAHPASSTPPAILPVYDPDQPIPEGYRLTSRPTVGVLGMGIGLFSAGWVTAVVTGIALGEEARKEPGGTDPNAFIPMYFPVAGPLVTLAILKPGPAEMGLLITDGIFQVAGSVGILVGSLKRSYRLVYTGEKASFEVTPAFGAGYAGVQTTGSF